MSSVSLDNNNCLLIQYDNFSKFPLHPQWLKARGQTTGASSLTPLLPTVFLDGTRMGSIDLLGVYQVNDIEEIRYLDAAQAGIRYGMGYPRGIIEIISIR